MVHGLYVICLQAKRPLAQSGCTEIKCKPNGGVNHYKAMACGKGYAQEKGIDFEETFLPTCCMTIVRSICSAAYVH